MKTIFSALALLPAILFSQNVSVDMMYSLPQQPAKEQFYPASMQSAFTVSDYQQLMQISAKHVMRQLAGGKKVYNYNPVNIGTSFYSSQSVSDCKNMPPAFFNQPAYGITASHNSESFNYKSGTAESSRITITPDFRFITAYDSVEVPSRKGDHFDVKLQARYFHAENARLLFAESWNFNPETGVFTKKIHQCGYLEKQERFGDSFYTWTMATDNHDSTGIQKTDNLFRKNMVIDVSVMYPEARIMYDSTYAHITGPDAVGELQSNFANLPEGERVKFLTALLSYAYAHPGKVFSASPTGIIDSLHPFTADKLNSIFVQIDTVQIEDPLNPGTYKEAWVKTETPLSSIYGLRFYEDWYYDPTEMIIKKKVKGIGLLLNQSDPQTGDVTIKDAGLYIKMN